MVGVIFDCSVPYGGNSLNDHLLQGPDPANNMLGLLLRFSKKPIGLACDVKKIFITSMSTKRTEIIYGSCSLVEMIFP